MRISWLSKWALAAAIGVGATAAPAHAQAVTLRLSSWLPPTHIIVSEMVQPWAKKVEEVTEGRVKVQILPSPLGSPQAHLDMTENGITDIAYGVHGYTPGRFALTEIAELPFLSDSAEKLSVAYWRVHSDMLAQANEHGNVKVLSVFTQGPGQIFNSVRPVNDLDDFKNLKIRIPTASTTELAKLLGIVPLQAPSSRTYEMISSGVADGIMFTDGSVTAFGLERVLKYGSLVPTGFYNASFYFVMNRQKWESLSDEDQRAIDEISGEAFARIAGIAWDGEDKRARDALKAAGVELSELKPEVLVALKERLADLEHQWIKRASAQLSNPAAALARLRKEVAGS